ncbi:MAG: acetyl-CoA carboxylase biotin carboxyl carrier protein subunit [Gemmatimonadaceae bacterium]
MRYTVRVGETEIAVDVEDGVATTGDSPLPARLEILAGTPEALLIVGSDVHRVTVATRGARGVYGLTIDGVRGEAEALDERSAAIRRLSATAPGPRRPTPLTAPMAGLIIRVAVAVGDQVTAGQGLVVMEAMKMENELRSASAGTVTLVRATPGVAVERGAVLVELA